MSNKKDMCNRSFRIWWNMLSRCKYPKVPNYKNYGGRGITVCERWKKFEAFLKDMGEPPSKDHSLDRIDNDGNYCAENCRWATRTEQNRNSRNARLVEYDGEMRHITDLEKEGKIKYATFYRRITLIGMSVEDALRPEAISNPPIGERNASAKLTESQVREIRNLYGAGGATFSAIAKKFGISKTNVSAIVKRRLWKHVA